MAIALFFYFVHQNSILDIHTLVAFVFQSLRMLFSLSLFSLILTDYDFLSILCFNHGVSKFKLHCSLFWVNKKTIICLF